MWKHKAKKRAVAWQRGIMANTSLVSFPQPSNAQTHFSHLSTSFLGASEKRAQERQHRWLILKGFLAGRSAPCLAQIVTTSVIYDRSDKTNSSYKVSKN